MPLPLQLNLSKFSQLNLSNFIHQLNLSNFTHQLNLSNFSQLTHQFLTHQILVSQLSFNAMTMPFLPNQLNYAYALDIQLVSFLLVSYGALQFVMPMPIYAYAYALVKFQLVNSSNFSYLAFFQLVMEHLTFSWLCLCLCTCQILVS